MDKKFIVLILGIVFGVISIGLIMVKGDPKNRVNLSSISEIGEGALYSTEQAFRTIAPISEGEEMLQGDRLHKRRFNAFGKSSKETEEWEKYVGEVGKRLVANVKRKGIQYKFHVIDRSSPYAFSGPGGHIYITTGLLKALRSESELAGILAHESVHVDAKHCAGRLLRQGGGRAYDALIGPGYSEAQETEADVGGVYLAAEAGYHPMAVIEAFKRIDTTYKAKDDNNSITPVGDTLGAAVGMIGRYFKSHPEAVERIDKIQKYIADKKIIGPTSRFYVGQRNYKERVSCTAKKYKEELKKDYVITEIKSPVTEKSDRV